MLERGPLGEGVKHREICPKLGVQNQGPSRRQKPVTNSRGTVVPGELRRHMQFWGVRGFSGTTLRTREAYFSSCPAADFHTQVVPILVHKNGSQKCGKNTLGAIARIEAITRRMGSKVAPKTWPKRFQNLSPKSGPQKDTTPNPTTPPKPATAEQT